MIKPVTVAIAGLGNRGREIYAQFQETYPELMRVTAVADTSPERVGEAASVFGLAPEMCFADAEEMAAKKSLADVMFICTPDRFHSAPAIAALNNGYHLLLEKPIAPTLAECRAVLEAAEKSGRYTSVCHVLRYTPFFQSLKQVIDDGKIGEVVTVQAIENIGYYHYAHSFVRGNWRSSAQSSPMILQKSCHDLDIIMWLTGKKLKSVSSYGSLYLFKNEKAPRGAAKRCLDGCLAKDSCPYDAEKIYISDKLTGIAHGRKGWPNSVLSSEPTPESIAEAIKSGPYGRCVYHCDNDVADHMVVNMELEDTVTASFTVSAFTSKQYRHMKIMGTAGDIIAEMDKNFITVTPYGQESQIIDIAALNNDLFGHGGGDKNMVKEFLQAVQGSASASSYMATVADSIGSHYACFAAEYSRLHKGIPVTENDLRILL